MHTNEVLEILHPRVVLRASGVHALDDGCDVAKDHRVHQGWGQRMQSSINTFASIFLSLSSEMFLNSPPISITQMEKIFSASVLAHTLPKPTLVRLLRVK